MRKHIELIKFNPVPAELKRFYHKPRYHKPFVIETKYGDVYKVTLHFCEDTSTYYFQSRYVKIPSEEVIFIEDRIWDHIRN